MSLPQKTAKVFGLFGLFCENPPPRCVKHYERAFHNHPSSVMDADTIREMRQYVSLDRKNPISQVSAAINNPNRVQKSGSTLLDLLCIPFTAKLFNGPMFGTTAEIYDGNGEMIAGYRDSCGWFDVPTKDETRFQYESAQIYCEAYRAAEAEIAAAKQTAAPAVSEDAPASFDVKA